MAFLPTALHHRSADHRIVRVQAQARHGHAQLRQHPIHPNTMLFGLKPTSRIKNPKIQTPIHKNARRPHNTAPIKPSEPITPINFLAAIKNSLKLPQIPFPKAHVSC